MRRLTDLCRRAWYWGRKPPARRSELAETVLLKPRPVPYPMPRPGDGKTRPGLRVAPWAAAQRGAHRRDEP